MADLPQVGAEVVLDTDSYDKSIDDALSRADELDSALNDLGGTIDATVDVDTSALNDLEDTSVDIEFNVDDSELPFDEIPDETNTDVNLTETEDAKTASEDLHFMANLKRIETVINIAGNVLDFVKDVGNMVVSPFLDVEDAVAKINAQTGGTGIADLGQFIRDIQAADLGDSVDQISDVVIAAQQLNAPIEEATTAALTFTHTFKDQDPTTVLTTLNTLVETGLVPNLQAAADLMTVAFQQGVNKGGDALNVVNANAQSWADMGLNGTQALSAINSLQDSGVDSASDAAKMLQTLDDALTTAASTANSPQAEALKTLGIENPKDSGQAMGADFIDGFAASFTNLPSDQQDLISGVLFGKGGKKFTGALEGLTTQGGPFGDIVGAASDAATEIDNSLRGAIDDFILQVNTSVTDLLSSKSIDLPGKIDALKKGFQDAVDVLASGGTVGEAIEVALNIPGFNDSVNRFEASIGDFAINVLELVASVQDFLGKDSSGTRSQIAKMSGDQLAFNLKVANPDEVGGEINRAMARGVKPEDVTKIANTSVNELIDSGDIDKAQQLVDSITAHNNELPALATGMGKSTQDLYDAFLALKSGSPEQIQDQLDKGNLIAPVALDTTDLQKQIDDAKAQIAQSKLDFGPKPQTPNPLGPLGAEQGVQTSPFLTAFDDFKTKAADADAASKTTADNIAQNFFGINTAVVENLATSNAALDTFAAKGEEVDTRIATALTDNTVTSSFDAVAASAETNFPVVIDWMEQTAAESAVFDNIVSLHMRSVLKQLNDANFLAMQTIANITSAQALGGGGGSTTTNTTNNVTVNNNNSNGAQTSNSQYQLSQALGSG